MKKIKIVGIGGGGNIAVNHMIASGVEANEAESVEFIAINIDRQQLQYSQTAHKILIGERYMKGHADINPEFAAMMAKESREEIIRAICGADIIFIVAGMSGKFSSGCSPVIAGIAQELGIFTVSVVSSPFRFEGERRMECAVNGVDILKNHTDALVVIPLETIRQNCEEEKATEFFDLKNHSVEPFSIYTEKFSGITEALAMADDVIFKCVKHLIKHYTIQ